MGRVGIYAPYGHFVHRVELFASFKRSKQEEWFFELPLQIQIRSEAESRTVIEWDIYIKSCPEFQIVFGNIEIRI